MCFVDSAYVFRVKAVTQKDTTHSNANGITENDKKKLFLSAGINSSLPTWI